MCITMKVIDKGKYIWSSDLSYFSKNHLDPSSQRLQTDLMVEFNRRIPYKSNLRLTLFFMKWGPGLHFWYRVCFISIKKSNVTLASYKLQNYMPLV